MSHVRCVQAREMAQILALHFVAVESRLLIHPVDRNAGDCCNQTVGHELPRRPAASYWALRCHRAAVDRLWADSLHFCRSVDVDMHFVGRHVEIAPDDGCCRQGVLGFDVGCTDDAVAEIGRIVVVDTAVESFLAVDRLVFSRSFLAQVESIPVTVGPLRPCLGCFRH